MYRSRIAFLTLVWGAVGCSDGTGPGSEDGTYALMEVDGTALPVEVASETWFADTIRIERGEWSRVSVVRLETEGAEPDPIRREADGFVRRHGDRIVLDFFCPPNALCVAPDTVVVLGSQLFRRNNRYGEESADDPLFRYVDVR